MPWLFRILSGNLGMFRFECCCFKGAKGATLFTNTRAPPKCIFLELIHWETDQDWCPGRSPGTVFFVTFSATHSRSN